jgi:hypothetical protein
MNLLARILGETAFVVLCGWSSAFVGWWFLVFPMALLAYRITSAILQRGQA